MGTPDAEMDMDAANAGEAMGDSTEVAAKAPTGKFTTAGEIRVIVEMTKPQWVAVRPWEGQDLLYFTNLLS